MKTTTGYENGRFALVVIDVQKKFSESTEGLREGTPGMIRTVNDAIGLFHFTGNPIIYAKYTGPMYDGHPTCEGGDDFTDGLIPPEANDRIVCKDHMNAFSESDLEDVLKEEGCDSVLLAGMVSQCCVIATYFGAFDRGFSSYILEGGTAATDPDNVEAVERICRTLTVDDLGRNAGFKGDVL